MDLEEEIYDKIEKLCDEADEHVKICEFNKAIKKYEQALELLPGDIEEYYEATKIYAAMGDAWYFAGEYEKSKGYFYDALNCPEGIANPYILFRLGGCLYECNDIEKAREYFIRTYMLDGLSLFEKHDEKYLGTIADMITDQCKENINMMSENNNSLNLKMSNSELSRENGKVISKEKIEEYIFDILDQCDELEFINNNEAALEKIKEGWDFLPEPKSSQDMSYLVLERIFDLCIKCNKFELANQWISLIFVADLERADGGHREFIAGRLAYEQGNLEIAKELFIIANAKSEGRLFRGKDMKKYRDLIK